MLSLTRPGRERFVGPKPRDSKGRPLAPEDAWGHDHLWWLDRMARTSRPLVERMTLVWHDWFATSNDGVGSQKLMLKQNRLFRGHALGSALPRPRSHAGDLPASGLRPCTAWCSRPRSVAMTPARASGDCCNEFSRSQALRRAIAGSGLPEIEAGMRFRPARVSRAAPFWRARPGSRWPSTAPDGCRCSTTESRRRRAGATGCS